MMEQPPPLQAPPPAGSWTQSMVFGVVAIVGSELVASVQLACLLYFMRGGDPFHMFWRTWFGLFVPGLLLYCTSRLGLFRRGVGWVIAALLASLVGLTTLILAVDFSEDYTNLGWSIENQLWVTGSFFTTAAVGLIRSLSRSLLIETTPPEKQGLVSSVASMAMSLFTAIHMFIVHGVVLNQTYADPLEYDPGGRLAICETVFGGLSIPMLCTLFADRRPVTDAPFALKLDRGGDDEPILALAKPFMFAICGYFLVQVAAAYGFLDNGSPLKYRTVGVFQVGALVGAAPFVLRVFQGKGGLVLLQIVAAIFTAGLVLSYSPAATTALYAFGGLGLGALRAAMFTFLGQTVTPDNTAEGVSIFVSFGLIAQAIAFGLSLLALEYGAGGVLSSGIIAVAALIMLRLPSSVERANPPP